MDNCVTSTAQIVFFRNKSTIDAANVSFSGKINCCNRQEVAIFRKYKCSNYDSRYPIRIIFENVVGINETP